MSEFKVPFIIKYGVKDNYKDVTQTAIRRCINKKILYIPSGDHNRAKIFGDPVVGTLKHIHIERKESEHTYLYNQKV